MGGTGGSANRACIADLDVTSSLSPLHCVPSGAVAMAKWQTWRRFDDVMLCVEFSSIPLQRPDEDDRVGMTVMRGE
jgi:hypothetical protein